MYKLEEIYQELILEHNKNPRNFRIPGWAWRGGKEFCECGCKEKMWLYFILNKIKDGYSLAPYFGTEKHVKYWTGDEIYGPFPLSHL